MFTIPIAQQPYVAATTAFPFPGSLVSANITADGTDGLSEETMIELIKINMLQVYPTTVSSVSHLSIITITDSSLTRSLIVCDFDVPILPVTLCVGPSGRDGIHALLQSLSRFDF